METGDSGNPLSSQPGGWDWDGSNRFGPNQLSSHWFMQAPAMSLASETICGMPTPEDIQDSSFPASWTQKRPKEQKAQKGWRPSAGSVVWFTQVLITFNSLPTFKKVRFKIDNWSFWKKKLNNWQHWPCTWAVSGKNNVSTTLSGQMGSGSSSHSCSALCTHSHLPAWTLLSSECVSPDLVQHLHFFQMRKHGSKNWRPWLKVTGSQLKPVYPSVVKDKQDTADQTPPCWEGDVVSFQTQRWVRILEAGCMDRIPDLDILLLSPGKLRVSHLGLEVCRYCNWHCY